MAVQPDRAMPAQTRDPAPTGQPDTVRAPEVIPALPAEHQPWQESRTWNALLPLLGVVTLIAVWWLWVVIFHVRSFLVPSPADIVHAFLRMPAYMVKGFETTLIETLLGFFVAVVFGLVTATALVASRTVERAMMPVIVAINAIPKLTLAPLLVVWMGFSPTPKVVMVFLICSFPVLVATMAGLTSTPSDIGELAKSLSASRWRTFVKVRVPWAMPQIFVGLKVSISLAVIGAVVAEYSGADSGLGYTIVAVGQQGDTPAAFAAIVLLSAMSMGLFYLVVALERWLLPWVRETSV